MELSRRVSFQEGTKKCWEGPQSCKVRKDLWNTAFHQEPDTQTKRGPNRQPNNGGDLSGTPNSGNKPDKSFT